MRAVHIHLQQFKNYTDVVWEPSPNLNLIVGKNGSGKTNLLDAFFYLALTKSMVGQNERQLIQEHHPFFLIESSWQTLHENKIAIKAYSDGVKKTFKVNNLEIERMSDHIGTIPVVLISPDDDRMIRDASDTRRKWMDGCISQESPDYLHHWLRYQRILRQRNQYLKDLKGTIYGKQTDLLDAYDEVLVTSGEVLTIYRRNFLDRLREKFTKYLSAIVPELEICSIILEEDTSGKELQQIFKEVRSKDIISQRTTKGPHRDDLLFEMKGNPIKKFGSQGQQKSFILALKMSQFELLSEAKEDVPVLLLDDLFDKLDDERIEKIMRLIRDNPVFGQIFITDARPERSMNYIRDIVHARVVDVSNGQLLIRNGN